MLIVVMGVSGCGKTTIGTGLSKALGLPFFDADDFHPEANVKKMESGFPLDDGDRQPWLTSLENHLFEQAKSGGCILACSALKERYRKLLSSRLELEWVYLKGSFSSIEKRLKNREGHFMGPKLLQSQFDALEEPQQCIEIDIELDPEEIIRRVTIKMNNNMKSSIGLIGLGVMGKSLSLNISNKGFDISVYNRIAEGEEFVVRDFLEENKQNSNISGFTELEPFIASLASPKKVFLMVKAGQVVDQLIEQLHPLLQAGDIIIDGGNSHYKDTESRYAYLQEKQIQFVGCGVSGGEEGALKGPSMMPGVKADVYKELAPIFESISAKDKDGQACCTPIGFGGAGHFVKMVHNGIEYAEMQYLAELYALLSVSMSNEAIADLFEQWNKGRQASFLLEITIDILRKKVEDDTYLLDLVLDKAGNKGTGSWSSIAAFELGVPASIMTAAVHARYMSSFKDQRIKMAIDRSEENGATFTEEVLSIVEAAYFAARILNHQQGFALIQAASDLYHWNLDLSAISRIWTNGCIIRSAYMHNCIQHFKQVKNLFEVDSTTTVLKEQEDALVEILTLGLKYKVAMPCLSAAYTYWLSMSSKDLPANMIQAQRDCFGAHTYQRKDRNNTEWFTSKWN